MATSAFDDRAKAPKEPELARVLGSSARPWGELKEQMASRFAPLSEEWVFSGKKHGWSLRLSQKKRAVVYLTPCAGYFRASFALGEKAAAGARDAGLPEPMVELITNAPKYPEGRAVRLEVRKARDLWSVIKIAEIKMAN